ncbi:MAG: RNA polymerase sigma factor [Vicinamibacterales bacterium]
MALGATPALTDEALGALLVDEPEYGWRAFVDQYTPSLLASIAREGVVDRDDAADVYLLVCERLAANGAARLRRHDPQKGPLAAWLTTIVRHVVVDWVRSRAGRRRLFGAITRLDRFDQRVFELYYWDHRSCSEIAELTGMEGHPTASLGEVLAALHRVDDAMSERHRRQLLATMARARRPSSVDTNDDAIGVLSSDPDPEQALRVRQLDDLFSKALASLPAEDAAIVRLTFVQGWTRDEIRRALHLDQLTRERITGILRALRTVLADLRVGRDEAATPGLRFLEGPS